MPPVFGDYLRLPKYGGIVQNRATSASLGSFDMAMPDEINALILRLNQELDDVEQLLIEGLNLARTRIEQSPNNTILIQLFATLNNYLLFVLTSTRRIEYAKSILSSDLVTLTQIQSAGEDLGWLLGQIVEARMVSKRIKERLENWV